MLNPRASFRSQTLACSEERISRAPGRGRPGSHFVGRRASRARARLSALNTPLSLCLCASVVHAVVASDTSAQQAWPTLGGNPARTSITTQPVPDLTLATWTCAVDEQSRPITFEAKAGVAVSPTHVLAAGFIDDFGPIWKLFWINRRSGVVERSAVIDAPVLESLTSPTIDLGTNTVLVASGYTLAAFDLVTGATRFEASFVNPLVNVSPLVVRAFHAPARVFVTDYDGFGDSASLHCVNLDAFSTGNPFTLGQVLWSAPIGASSGNTAAYDAARGRIITAAVGLFASDPGEVLAFPAHATAAPPPAWRFVNPAGAGFFGGVSVDGSNVLAASYAFFGGLSSGNLVRLRAADGTMLSNAPANRTASIPIALPGDTLGRVALSTGVQGFGSLPSLQVFGFTTSVAPAFTWSTHVRTWSDSNHNTVIENGEFTPIGGWNLQPILSTSGVGTRLVVGGGDNVLRVLNLAGVTGSSSAVSVVQSVAGITGSPAIAGGNLYAIGAAGLRSFGALPLLLDVNRDGLVDVEDIYAWEQGRGSRDVDGSGAVNAADREQLIGAIRANEEAEQTEGRR